MTYETITVQVGDDYICTIALNRPEQLNTFTLALARELDQALWEAEVSNKVRVVVVKGNGKVFCAGIDVAGLEDKSVQELRNWIECMETPLVSISRMSKPVIAQVHGAAAANGAGLVAAADLAIASEKARFGLTAINVGLNCVGPVIPVSRSIGRKKALEMLFFGELIPAPEAARMGLINRVVAEEELEEETRKWAATLAAKSPVAMQNAKKSFYTAADCDYYKAFDFMNDAFARLCSSADAKEGVAAFREKREPVWQEK
ncbi:MAG: enoyl-CoA hydratase/isomerase family protein [Desulfobulbaceae bacterium]|nr:enoyl-CoA hydratase/isomerase family protein [Desulfobulbaceae bacterium]